MGYLGSVGSDVVSTIWDFVLTSWDYLGFLTKIENAFKKYKRLKTMSDDRRPKTLDSAGPQVSEVCSTSSAYIGGDEDPMIAGR